MEFSKKTTILFSPHMHERLSEIAQHKRTSLGELVRYACEKEYGLVSNERRLDAVRRLGGMTLEMLP